MDFRAGEVGNPLRVPVQKAAYHNGALDSFNGSKYLGLVCTPLEDLMDPHVTR